MMSVNAVKNAINYIMDKMNNSDDEIVASIIGLSNSNTPEKIEQDLEWDQRQFDILVDALWEVIRDYMETKNNEEYE